MVVTPKYFNWLRPEITALVPGEAKRILDVGCASGRLGEALKARQACEVHGIEPVATAAADAGKRLDRLWEGTVESVIPRLPEAYFDCVVLADILEHLVDPWTVLKQLKEKIAPGGKVVASIPNVQNWKVLGGLLEGRWEYESEGLLDRTHLRFFTRRSAEEMFWSAGLRIVEMAGTANGAGPTKQTVRALRRAGLTAGRLEKDARVFQHLVVAERPIPRSQDDAWPKVSVVILNWNGKDDTLECLESVRRIDYPNFEVIVVDNGSIDSSVPRIREQFPEAVVLEAGRNLGYAGGNNVGIREALRRGAEFVLVLNNDTIIDSLAVRQLVSAGKVIGNVGMLGLKVYSHGDPLRIQYAGAQEDAENARFVYCGAGQVDDGVSYEQIRETPYVYGAAFMVSAKAVADVGLLDERYFLCYEETDWCNRMRKKEYRIYFVPQALVWHRGESPSFGGKQSPLQTYFMCRNQLLWAERHMPTRAWLKLVASRSRIVVPVLGIRQIRSLRMAYWACRGWMLTLRRRKKDSVERARLAAFRDYVLRRFGDCPPAVRRMNGERSRVQEEGHVNHVVEETLK